MEACCMGIGNKPVAMLGIGTGLGSGGTAVAGSWEFDTGTADADPGAGRYRLNNADPALATFIYIHDDADNGVDFSPIVMQLGSNSDVYLQQGADEKSAVLYGVTGTPTNGTTYWRIPVVFRDKSTNDLAANQLYGFLFFVGGAGGGGTVTSVAAGAGMNFTTITGAGSVVMGTPGSLTDSTTNQVTGTTHTHAVSGLTPNVGVRAWRNTSQVLNTLTETKIGFNSEADDDGNDFSVSTSQFTAPTTGRYAISAAMELTVAAGPTRAELRIYQNSTERRRADVSIETAGTIFPEVSIELKLTAGDTVEIRAWQNSGYASTIQAIDTNFTVAQIGKV